MRPPPSATCTVSVKTLPDELSKSSVLASPYVPVQHVTADVSVTRPEAPSTWKRDAPLPPVMEKVRLAHLEKGVSGSEATSAPPPAPPLHESAVPGGELLKSVCSCTRHACAAIVGYSFTSVT